MAKSLTFAEFDPTNTANKAFQRDLATLLELPEATLHEVIENLGRTIAPLPEDEVEESREHMDAARCLAFFLLSFRDRRKAKDTIADLIDDLRDYGLLDSEGAERLATILRRLKEERLVEDADRRLAYASATSGAMPTLVGVATTVELRAVQTKEYQMADDVEQYTPEIARFIPVASIRLRSNESDSSVFYFQVTEKKLTLLLDALQATRKDMQHFESLIRIESSSPTAVHEDGDGEAAGDHTDAE